MKDDTKPYVHNSGHKKKELIPKKVTLYEFFGSTSMLCSSCTRPVGTGVYVSGHLMGSGAKPFLILCPECRAYLKEIL